MNQFHILGYIGFIFKAQINLMQFSKEFKVSEILCVVTFDTMCQHRTMETPKSENV
jgi:hypothetical protein